LAKITFFGLNEGIKTFESALTQSIGHVREYSERLGQLFLGKIFRRPTYFDGLWHCNIKIFRLFNKESRRHFICFWRVNEIKTKQIFLLAGTYMEAVAIIRRIRDESAIFQHNPFSIDLVRELQQARSKQQQQ